MAASAPVRDPLWFLARQLQTGGFIADDGGSPVSVSVAPVTIPVSVDGHPVTPGLGADLEAEPDPAGGSVDTRTRVRYACELLRRLADEATPAGVLAAVRTGLVAQFPLRPVHADPGLLAVTQRLPDPVAIYEVWVAGVGASGTSGQLPPVAGVGNSQTKVERAARSWVAWMTGRLGTSGPPAHWDPARLAYQVDASAGQGTSALTLRADGYDGSGLDWYSFDRSALAQAPTVAAAISVRPAPVSYAGMPERGYWTLEDGTVNLDMLAATDPARHLLVAFAHSYGNDWFVIPLQVPPGVTMIAGLKVTDTFGSVTDISAAAALDGPEARFRLWELDVVDAGADEGRGLRLMLPAAAPPLEGPALEDVVLERDEMANLGWLVELTTTDPDGSRVDRYRRWLTLRTSTDPSYHPGEATEELYYRLGTTLPDFWTPLRSLTGAAGKAKLGVAALPNGATDVSSHGVTGQLLPDLRPTQIDDDEVSRAGTQVTRFDRLSYDPNAAGTAAGRRVWRVRRRRAGFGEASSGLRFDTMGPPAPKSNDIVRNARLDLGHRDGTAVATDRSGRLPSPARDWLLVNARDGQTRGVLEPSTRTGRGWQLHVTTTKAGSGVGQRLDIGDRGPCNVRVKVWVYVVAGQVSIAAGPGGSMRASATSTTTGQWEELHGRASGSPVNFLDVLAVDGSAEFLLDAGSVRPV